MIDQTFPPHHDDPADDRVASDRETFERRRAWQKTMHEAGWVGISWPKEYGGRGATLIERALAWRPGMPLELLDETLDMIHYTLSIADCRL